MAPFPLLLFLAVLSLHHFRVTANIINVNEIYEMHIYHAVLWVLFPRLLYYPIMNTVSRVITTNASASRNKRQFFSFRGTYYVVYIMHVLRYFLYHAPHNTAYFYEEKLPVREET